MGILQFFLFSAVALLLIVGLVALFSGESDKDKKLRLAKLRRLRAKMYREPKRNCPVDKIKMKKQLVASVLIVDKCEKCGGTWLDSNELTRVKGMARDEGYSDGRSAGHSSGLATGMIIASSMSSSRPA